MRKSCKPVFGISVFIFIICGVLLIPSMGGSARAQDCVIEICKQLRGGTDGGGTLFPFFAFDGDAVQLFELEAGECRDLSFDLGTEITVIEEPIPGWILSSVGFDTNNIIATTIPGGIRLECLQGGTGSSFFNNIVGSQFNIPTLSGWGMIAAAGGLMLVGAYYAMRWRKTSA